MDYSNETVSSSLNSDAQNDRVNVDVDLVGRKEKAMVRNKRERKLRLAIWNFSGLCSDRKQKEIGELLDKHNLDVVAGQESWEKEENRIDVEGYKWFGKPYNYTLLSCFAKIIINVKCHKRSPIRDFSKCG